MEELKTGFYVSTNCKGCISKDVNGTKLRDWIDEQKVNGLPTPKIVEGLRKKGVHVTQPNLDRHFRNHSVWIKKEREIVSDKSRLIIARQQGENREAQEEIQKLINVGGDRIDAGEIMVDKELYMFALNKQTMTPENVSIENLVMNFGDALIESHKSNRQIFKGEVKTVETVTQEP